MAPGEVPTGERAHSGKYRARSGSGYCSKSAERPGLASQNSNVRLASCCPLVPCPRCSLAQLRRQRGRPCHRRRRLARQPRGFQCRDGVARARRAAHTDVKQGWRAFRHTTLLGARQATVACEVERASTGLVVSSRTGFGTADTGLADERPTVDHPCNSTSCAPHNPRGRMYAKPSQDAGFGRRALASHGTERQRGIPKSNLTPEDERLRCAHHPFVAPALPSAVAGHLHRP
jgi:hypothetical protein